MGVLNEWMVMSVVAVGVMVVEAVENIFLHQTYTTDANLQNLFFCAAFSEPQFTPVYRRVKLRQFFAEPL